MRLFPRLSTVAGLIVLGLVIVLARASTVRAADINPDEIKAALRTTTTEEGGFIDRVVTMVNSGALPRDLFQSCFLWAQKKSHHKYQYFKRALIARAADVGISLS
jgi:hypothetical protein